MTEKKVQIDIKNKKAYFDYKIEEHFEAGIVLTGDEIKTVRARRVNMTGSYVKIIGGEIFWLGGNISVKLGDPQKTRKLLLHEAEIERLFGKVSEQGYAIIPLRLYMKRGRAKLEIGLGKGMKKYDVREKLKKQDIERDVAQTLRIKD